MPQQPNYASLGQLVQSKYPQYQNMDAAQVGQAVAQKYPQYDQLLQSGKLPQPLQPGQLPDTGNVLGNAINSTGNLIGGAASAIGNAFNPNPDQNTLVNIGRGVLGAGEQASNAVLGTGFNDRNTQIAGGMESYFNNRYGLSDLAQGNLQGALGKIARTLYTDPAGAAADISMLLEGGGGLLKSLGTAGKVGDMGDIANAAYEGNKAAAIEAASKSGQLGTAAQIGQGVSDVGKAVNPFRIAGNVVGGAVKLANKAISSGVGLSSKLGYSGANDVINAARGAEGAPNIEQMTNMARGATTGEDVVNQLVDARNNLLEKSRKDYNSMLQTVDENYRKTNLTQKGNSLATVMQNNKLADEAAAAGQTAGETFPLSTIGTKGVATRVANELGIAIKDDGSLDFSNSSVPRDQYRTVQNMFDDIREWTRTTPRGINDLENKVAGYYKPVVTDAGGKVSNYISSKLSNGLKDYLRERIPEFQAGDELFAKQKAILKDFKRDFSLGGKAGPQTILNKVRKAATADGDLRAGLVSQLEGLSGIDLKAVSIGSKAQGWTPHSLLASGELIGSFIHPQLLASLAFTSPRFAFEFLRGLGIAENKIGGIMDAIHSSQIGLIASRVGSLSQNQGNRQSPSAIGQSQKSQFPGGASQSRSIRVRLSK